MSIFDDKPWATEYIGEGPARTFDDFYTTTVDPGTIDWWREPQDWEAWESGNLSKTKPVIPNRFPWEPVPITDKIKRVGVGIGSRMAETGRAAFGRIPPRIRTGLKWAGGIGLSIGAIYLYNRITAKDDAYNTIEGMPELGLASVQRKILTDFGSGYRGLLVGALMSVDDTALYLARTGRLDDLARYLQEVSIPKENEGYQTIEGMHPGGRGMATRIIRSNTPFGSKFRRFANWLIGGTVEETARAGGAGVFQRLTRFMQREGVRILQPRSVIGGKYGAAWAERIAKDKAATYSMIMGYEGKKEVAPVVAIDPEGVKRILSYRLGRPLSETESKRLAVPFAVAHEGTEALQVIRIAEKQGLRRWQDPEKIEAGMSMFNALRRTGRIGGHQGLLPIFNEIYSAALHSPEMFQMAKAYRLKELGAAAEKAMSMNDPAYWKEISKYVSTSRKIISNVERKLVPRIERARLMHIEGMPSGGMAHAMRPEPFKSPGGWLTRAFGSLFPKKAAPEVVAYMGESIAGKGLLSPARAASMAKGETLESFAGKLRGELTGQNIDIWTFRGKEGTAQYQELLQEFGTAHGVDVTAAKAGAFSVEMEGKRTVLMDVGSLRESFGRVSQRLGAPGKAVESEQFLNTVLYHEVLEAQSHAALTLRSKMGGHASSQVLIGEGGFVKHIGDKNLEKLMYKIRKGTAGLYEGAEYEVKAFEAGYALEAGGRRASKLAELRSGFETITPKTHNTAVTSGELLATQKEVWQGATSGGKKHLQPSGKHVKQLSRHGGGV